MFTRSNNTLHGKCLTTAFTSRSSYCYDVGLLTNTRPSRSATQPLKDCCSILCVAVWHTLRGQFYYIIRVRRATCESTGVTSNTWDTFWVTTNLRSPLTADISSALIHCYSNTGCNTSVEFLVIPKFTVFLETIMHNWGHEINTPLGKPAGCTLKRMTHSPGGQLMSQGT